jgi:4-amino-4-deoxy-L-arabinose transferase-like glycosyltransferase
MPVDSRPAERLWLRRYRAPLALGLLLLAILGLRLPHLEADPPLNLDWSGGYFADEMALAHNARNKVLFGTWISDEWNPLIYSPLQTLLEYVFFSVLGVGLVSLRLVNIVLLFLGFWLLLLTLGRDRDRPTAALAVGLLGFNYLFLMYNRIGLNDTFLIFPMLLTLYLWRRGLDQPRYLILAGIGAFSCYVTKATALYFVLAVALSLVWSFLPRVREPGGLKKGLHALVFFLSGLGLSFFLWYGFFFLPHQARFASVKRMWFHLAIPRNLGEFWINLTSPLLLRYFSLSPVELLVGLSFIPWLFLARRKDWKKITPLEVLLCLWLVGGYLALNGLNYRPLRYYLALLPPLIILASLLLLKIWHWPASGAFKLRPVVLQGGLYLLWILLMGWYALGFHKLAKETLALAGLVAVILLAAWWQPRLLGLNGAGADRQTRTRLLFRSAVAGLIGFGLILHGIHYWRWVQAPAYTVRDTSRELGRLPEQALIAGLWAPLATIENRHRSLYIAENWVNQRRAFTTHPITHLFLWEGNHQQEVRFFNKKYPEIMARAVLLKTYLLDNSPARFYQVDRF